MSNRLPTAEELRAMKEVRDHENAKQEVQELTPMGKPDHIPHDVWLLVQENGRLATERLNEILRSPRFMRLRPGDQAKIIKLAQDRAYGVPTSPKEDKKNNKFLDLTAEGMRALSSRAELPEYRNVTQRASKDDKQE